jgi:hypothetical protein
MTEASAEEILAFVGSQFSSADQPGADGTFQPPNNFEQHETQTVALEEDRCGGMTPMERYLACRNQPVQITVAQPPRDGARLG